MSNRINFGNIIGSSTPRTKEQSNERFIFLKQEYRRACDREGDEEDKEIYDAIKSFAIIVLSGLVFFTIIVLSCL